MNLIEKRSGVRMTCFASFTPDIMVGANLTLVAKTSIRDFSLKENDFFSLSAVRRPSIFESMFSSKVGDKKWS